MSQAESGKPRRANIVLCKIGDGGFHLSGSQAQQGRVRALTPLNVSDPFGVIFMME